MSIKNLYIIMFLFLCWSCNKDDIDTTNQWELTTDEWNELIILSDTSTIIDYTEFGERLSRIQDIFSIHEDPRGTFTTLYKHITLAAINSADAGLYQDNQFVNDFGVAFGKFYLVNLKYHLLNQPTNYVWTAFYNECEQFEHRTRLVVLGMMSHISKDILDALVSINVTESQEEDWVLISTHLMNGIAGFEEEFELEYKTEVSDLINLFGFGGLIDEIYGEGATIYTILNELRYVAYEDALKYLDGYGTEMEFKTHQRFKEQQNLLELLDNLGLLP